MGHSLKGCGSEASNFVLKVKRASKARHEALLEARAHAGKARIVANTFHDLQGAIDEDIWQKIRRLMKDYNMTIQETDLRPRPNIFLAYITSL